jgi:GNAT superfamily N-acetyltransferase
MKTFSQFIIEAKEARPPEKYLRKIDQVYGKKYPGVNVDVSHDEKTGDFRVNQLWVPPNMQGKGIGTEIMNNLTALADKKKKRMTLTQDPDKGKKAKLAKFYKSHGFQSNRGKSRDFTTRDTDIRNPR